MVGIVFSSLFLLVIPNICLGLSDKDVEMLIERVQALEVKEETLRHEFETKSLEMKAEIKKLSTKVDRQDQEIADLKNKLETQGYTDNDVYREDRIAVSDESTMGEINEFDDPVKQGVEENTTNRKTDKLFVNTNDDLEVLKPTDNKRSIFNDLLREKLAGIQEGPIAFHATTDKGVMPHFDKGQHIILDVTLLNIGGGYHDQHGVFITPKNGIYIFSASGASGMHPHSDLQLQIVKDGSLLGRTFAHGDASYDQGSTTVVTQLNAGDEVWLEVWFPVTDGSILGFRFTSFTGCLIAEL